MKLKLQLTILFFAFSIFSLVSQDFTYEDTWTDNGIEITGTDAQSLNLVYSLKEFALQDVEINRTMMQSIALPGSILPNDEGAPDVPGSGYYIAMPQGSTPMLRIKDIRKEVLKNIELAPAPRIPLDTEKGPLQYNRDEKIYNKNEFYPASPIRLSKPTAIRGVDAAILGITPFQYNPVTKELIVIRDIEIEIIFEGGNGIFGDDRLRSRWFDPILENIFLNYEELPEIDYSHASSGNNRDDGGEYLIITPDDPVFLPWADTLRRFRNMQGISTKVVTTTEVGGNSASAVEAYIDNAYNTWTIPPVAVLIMADYGTASDRIMSPIWNSYCASDHIYGDVNGNGMADIILARMTAQNNTHLSNMIGKMLSHERTPPMNADFYNNPITALGWQTERWFQICSESVGGYFKHVQGKDPVRINEVYDGDPSVDPWSTATNTNMILNVFGPNGLGYIPATPAELGDWWDGDATMINNAINDGAFILQHRDHGGNTGWGEPDYGNSDIDGLTNEEYCFVFSVNCLTGKYNWSSECFTEKFHRSQYGALGLIAASEVSYSFVNDTYVWGLYDHLWPDFLPSYATEPDHRGLYPSFGNVAGKYYLKQSNWPYNGNSKEVTYNLFHHHGDAFLTLYSEVPQNLTVMHNSVLLGGLGSFTVTADSGALIGLSVDGELLGSADATGEPVTIPIEPQIPGTIMEVVVTKTNHLRYHAEVEVISPDIPYVIYDSYEINDANGNNNGNMDYIDSVLLTLGVQNVGNIDANNVSAKLLSQDEFISITDSTEFYGDILAHETVTIEDAFSFDVSTDLPDGHMVYFTLESTDGDSVWYSNFYIIGHAPVLVYEDLQITDPTGNGNNRLDPGETAEFHISVKNNGGAEAYNVSGELQNDDGYISFGNNNLAYGMINTGETKSEVFMVTADESTPGGFNAGFDFIAEADYNISMIDSFNINIGQYAALLLDLDPNNNSGPAIMEVFDNMDLIAHYSTTIPEDLGVYKSVFVFLGVIFTGHQLTEPEAILLADYLDNGGRIYMEGRRTWYDDPQTSLHPMFNINYVHDTWFEFDTITGIEGTFTEGMQFDVSGSSPYNDYYLEPEGDAFTVLTSPVEEYGCAVAYDEGTYKTVGASFEMGSLVDGQYPSTKQELILQILDFFGNILTGINNPLDINNPQDNFTLYPNPVKNNIGMTLRLESDTKVNIGLFDLNGQLIHTFASEKMNAGIQHLSFNLENTIPTGIYLCRLHANDSVITRKLVVIQ